MPKTQNGFVGILTAVAALFLIVTVGASTIAALKNQNINEKAASACFDSCRVGSGTQVCNCRCFNQCTRPDSQPAAPPASTVVSNSYSTCSSATGHAWCGGCGGFCIKVAGTTCNQEIAKKCGETTPTTSCTAATNNAVALYSGIGDCRKCINGLWTKYPADGSACKLTDLTIVPVYLQQQYNDAVVAQKTPIPTPKPTPSPSPKPTPTRSPSPRPHVQPTFAPNLRTPSPRPTATSGNLGSRTMSPRSTPTRSPSPRPHVQPTFAPARTATPRPRVQPTFASNSRTPSPSPRPRIQPTFAPTFRTPSPSPRPRVQPTFAPNIRTPSPSPRQFVQATLAPNLKTPAPTPRPQPTQGGFVGTGTTYFNESCNNQCSTREKCVWNGDRTYKCELMTNITLITGERRCRGTLSEQWDGSKWIATYCNYGCSNEVCNSKPRAPQPTFAPTLKTPSPTPRPHVQPTIKGYVGTGPVPATGIVNTINNILNSVQNLFTPPVPSSPGSHTTRTTPQTIVESAPAEAVAQPQIVNNVQPRFYTQTEDDLGSYIINTIDGPREFRLIGCGPTTVSNILNQLGLANLTPHQIAELMDTLDWGYYGTSLFQNSTLTKVLNDYNVDLKLYNKSFYNLNSYSSPKDLIFISGDFNYNGRIIPHISYLEFTGDINKIILKDNLFIKDAACKVVGDANLECTNPNGERLTINLVNSPVYLIPPPAKPVTATPNQNNNSPSVGGNTATRTITPIITTTQPDRGGLTGTGQLPIPIIGPVINYISNNVIGPIQNVVQNIINIITGTSSPSNGGSTGGHSSFNNVITDTNLPSNSNFGQILNPQDVVSDAPTPYYSAPPSGLTSHTSGNCTINSKGQYCDGKRMHELYIALREQPDAWWNADGNFTHADFFALMLMAESTGGSPQLLDAIIVASSNQLWGSAPDHTPYCSTEDCSAGIFNFVGATMQSAGGRYNALIDNPSPETLANLGVSESVANSLAQNGITLDTIANDTIYDPVSQVWNNDVPIMWGNANCGDICEGLDANWINNAQNSGSNDRCGLYHVEGEGAVAAVYTANQEYNLRNNFCNNP